MILLIMNWNAFWNTRYNLSLKSDFAIYETGLQAKKIISEHYCEMDNIQNNIINLQNIIDNKSWFDLDYTTVVNELNKQISNYKDGIKSRKESIKYYEHKIHLINHMLSVIEFPKKIPMT